MRLVAETVLGRTTCDMARKSRVQASPAAMIGRVIFFSGTPQALRAMSSLEWLRMPRVTTPARRMHTGLICSMMKGMLSRKNLTISPMDLPFSRKLSIFSKKSMSR